MRYQLPFEENLEHSYRMVAPVVRFQNPEEVAGHSVNKNVLEALKQPMALDEASKRGTTKGSSTFSVTFSASMAGFGGSIL